MGWEKHGCFRRRRFLRFVISYSIGGFFRRRRNETGTFTVKFLLNDLWSLTFWTKKRRRRKQPLSPGSALYRPVKFWARESFSFDSWFTHPGHQSIKRWFLKIGGITPLKPKIQNVFRLFISHFLLNFYVILRAIFASTPALALNNSWNLMDYFKS